MHGGAFVRKLKWKYFLYLPLYQSFALSLVGSFSKGSLFKRCEQKNAPQFSIIPEYVKEHFHVWNRWETQPTYIYPSKCDDMNLFGIRREKRPNKKNIYICIIQANRCESLAQTTAWHVNIKYQIHDAVRNTFARSWNLHEFLLHWMENQSMYLWH